MFYKLQLQYQSMHFMLNLGTKLLTWYFNMILWNVIVIYLWTRTRKLPLIFRSPEVKLDLAILFQLFNLNVAARVLLEDYISKSAITNDFVQFIFGRVLLEHSLGKMWYLRSSSIWFLCLVFLLRVQCFGYSTLLSAFSW